MTILTNTTAVNLVSILIGLGIASIFRKVCKEGKCVVVNGPQINDIEKKIYKIDERCYTYKPTATMCS